MKETGDIREVCSHTQEDVEVSERLTRVAGQIRKAERVRSAPTATGRIGKRALFALEDDSEVAEELTRVAGQ